MLKVFGNRVAIDPESIITVNRQSYRVDNVYPWIITYYANKKGFRGQIMSIPVDEALAMEVIDYINEKSKADLEWQEQNKKGWIVHA
jgi:hypothetical protein